MALELQEMSRRREYGAEGEAEEKDADGRSSYGKANRAQSTATSTTRPGGFNEPRRQGFPHSSAARGSDAQVRARAG